MTLIAERTVGPTFSGAIRIATADAHRAAEATPLLFSLLRGELPIAAYGRLIAQQHAIYAALEAANQAMAEDPAVCDFVRPEMARLPALERDAAALLGVDWRSRPEAELVPATRTYVERLQEVGASWPAGWVGHQYVRYLGDLSGGVILRRRIETVYGIDASCGTAFYDFPAVPDPAAWKAAYRERLDRVTWGPDEQARVIEEILTAYRLNTELLEELGA